MFNYAQINNQGIVFAVSQLKSKINNPSMIEVEDYSTQYIGKKFDAENNIFIDVPKTKEQLLQELKEEYLPQIKDADLLGDLEEKTRLQQEYLQKKSALEAV